MFCVAFEDCCPALIPEIIETLYTFIFREQIDDFVDLLFHLGRKVSVYLFTLDCFQPLRQFPHPTREFRIDFSSAHLHDQIPDLVPRDLRQLVAPLRLLRIDTVQLMTEDLRCEVTLDLFQPAPFQVSGMRWIVRVQQHMDVWMRPLVVKRAVPSERFRRNVELPG